MYANLESKVGIVTGASRGIGSAIAKAMANVGASVVVNYLSGRSKAKDVVSAIHQAGGHALSVQGDVSKVADSRHIVDAAFSSFGRIDCLVNNSGIYHFAPLESITEDDFHRQFNVNVLGFRKRILRRSSITSFTSRANLDDAPRQGRDAPRIDLQS